MGRGCIQIFNGICERVRERESTQKKKRNSRCDAYHRRVYQRRRSFTCHTVNYDSSPAQTMASTFVGFVSYLCQQRSRAASIIVFVY